MKYLLSAILVVSLPYVSAKAMSHDSDTDERCYKLRSDSKAVRVVSDLLCVKGRDSDKDLANVVITLKTLVSTKWKDIGKFKLQLLSSSDCLYSNEDVFGVANPEGSLFNELQIVFYGNIDAGSGEELGKVSIGKNTFHYEYTKPFEN